jgi:predicted DCC family thiol-disulfide oxidoreductase YuxK
MIAEPARGHPSPTFTVLTPTVSTRGPATLEAADRRIRGYDRGVPPAYDIEVFFDGDCPLCMREIRMLRALDRRRRVLFTDIAAPGFDVERVGITWQALMDRIHARLSDGTIIEGVEVFRRLYAAVGFGPLVALTRFAPIARVLDAAYLRFAKNRLKWTGRCAEDGCSVARQSVQPRSSQPA